jgi:hypothetical protein
MLWNLQGASVAAAPSAAPAPQEHLATAGITHAEAAVFLRRLQLAVKTRDADAVASLTIFPLTVRGKPGPANASELTQHSAEIFNEKVRAAVLGQTVDSLFANWRGLMIGNGDVWASALCDADSPPNGCKNPRIVIVSVNN